MTGALQPGAVDQLTALATRIVAPNAGPMTLDGTNTYVLRAPGAAGAVVVDPGPTDAGHLDRIVELGPVELIILTHHHHDHTEAAEVLAARTDAPVRALNPELCHRGLPLRDGEQIDAGGTVVEVIHTPGHTADSVSLRLPGDAGLDQTPRPSVLTGDTILGRGTTIIAQPDGSLGDYLASMRALIALGAASRMLPAHGPAHDDLAVVAQGYLDHRLARLGEVRDTLSALGLAAAVDDDTVRAVTDAVYPDVDPAIRFAAEASTRAQLEYLADD